MVSLYSTIIEYIIYVTAMKDKYIQVSVFSAQLELHDRTKRLISHFQRSRLRKLIVVQLIKKFSEFKEWQVSLWR